MYNNRRVSLGDKSMIINLYDILSVPGKELTVEAGLEEARVTFQGEAWILPMKNHFILH